MLPEQTRRRVDALWDRIWAGGVTNPLTAVEYLSTLLLLRRLADDARGGGRAGWADLERSAAAGDGAAAAAQLAALQATYGIGVSPEVSAASTWSDVGLLADAMREIAGLVGTERGHDMLGDVFEHVLSRLSTAGHFGQFRTPGHLIQLLVAAVDPRPGEAVLDPAAGTGGFLIAADAHRREAGGSAGPVVGCEVDPTMARIARTNLLLHGVADGRIELGDGLATGDRDADVVLANPPFAGTVRPERVAAFGSGATKTELLFVELIMRRLRPGGRAGVIVPTGVLTSASRGARWVRRELLEANRLRAVVELPPGVFRPYTGVTTAVLLWSNDGPTDEVLMVRVDSDGFSRDDRRRPVAEDDLPAALDLLRGRRAELPHARVAASTIVAHGYGLSPGRYIGPRRTAQGAPQARTAADAVGDARAALAALDREIAEFERWAR